MRSQVLTAGFRSGLLYPLGGKPSLFSDRFQLGGPTSVRSFKVNGIGPKDNGAHPASLDANQRDHLPGDFIGGDLHWSAGLSVFSPIPRREHWPVQLHTFLNAGRLVSMRQGAQRRFAFCVILGQLRTDRSLVGNVGQLLHRPAASAGFGIVYSPGASVRLEINFGLPLMAASSDATRKGLAVGIGIDFL
jgi:outer membrane protein insertion porin family